jgi:urea carboxylase
MGIRSVAIYSEADAMHRTCATPTRRTASAPRTAAASYLRQERSFLDRARAAAARPSTRVTASCPRTRRSRRLRSRRHAFIGPTPAQMRQFGLKHTARELAHAGRPAAAARHGSAGRPGRALARPKPIGYPVMLKSTAGGGGIGMRRCNDAPSSRSSFAAVQRLAEGNFRNAGVFLEKFVARARHIEVQIFGDGAGRVIALGERDCSVQRRNQKVIEESPAPGLSDEARRELHDAAVRPRRAVGYRSAARSSSSTTRCAAPLLPRGQHAPAGGTRRHRGSRRRRLWSSG